MIAELLLPSATDVYVKLADYLVTLTELVLVLAVLALIFRSRPSADSPRFRRFEKFFHQYALRRTRAVLTCGLVVLVLRAALIPLLGIPEPMWHDEFSFLLAADTFAHGRVTNPTHPMWEHFESFHIIQKPTYMSMYAPGQGLILAAGELLGTPWLAQWLAGALMCSALCWMLQAWIPPAWALFGGLLAGLRIALLSYWMNSYFCGSLTAIGGALVLGSLPRLRKYARPRDALWMALGLVLLANTRPYEGLVFSIPVALAMLFWLWKPKSFTRALAFRRVVLPVLLVLIIAGAAMGYYFWRVTGSPLVMPYEVDRATYATAPYFVWGKARPMPVYRHAVMRNFYQDWEDADYRANLSPLGFIGRAGHKAFYLWMFFLGPALTVPLLGFPWVFRDRRMRFPLLLAGFFILGLLVETWTGSHYAAPATCLVYLLLLQSMRHLRFWKWRQRPVGLSLVRAVPTVAVAMILLRISAAAVHAPLEPPWSRGNLQRAQILRTLQPTPEKNLIIVQYKPDHGSQLEWVYNRADIDAARVVWARDMGPAKNQELLRYFKDRKVWWLEADDRPPQLLPYLSSQPYGERGANH
jgi:hypothetical protein